MSADNLLIRASAAGLIMTASEKPIEKAMTCQNYLKQLFREKKYQRKQEISTKYMEKGITQEEDAITLFSRFSKIVFFKNETNLKNEFCSGTPDLYLGESIDKAIEGFDTKCSWSLWTFPFENDKLDANYEWQNHVYMALTGAKKWTTVFCLVNASASLVDAEKKKVFFQMGCPDEENFQYREKCINIEKNMIFDMVQFKSDNPFYDLHCKSWDYDIPMAERIVQCPVEYSEASIMQLYLRIQECRNWLNKNCYKTEMQVSSFQ